LRDLFHLYHSTRDFITLENLDEAIESAFALSNRNDAFYRRNESSLHELEKALQARQAHDKLMQLPEHGEATSSSYYLNVPPRKFNDPTHTLPKSEAPSIPSIREVAVRSALYGLDVYDKTPLPGLEAVEEELATRKEASQKEL